MEPSTVFKDTFTCGGFWLDGAKIRSFPFLRSEKRIFMWSMFVSAVGKYHINLLFSAFFQSDVIYLFLVKWFVYFWLCYFAVLFLNQSFLFVTSIFLASSLSGTGRRTRYPPHMDQGAQNNSESSKSSLETKIMYYKNPNLK